MDPRILWPKDPKRHGASDPTKRALLRASLGTKFPRMRGDPWTHGPKNQGTQKPMEPIAQWPRAAMGPRPKDATAPRTHALNKLSHAIPLLSIN